MKKFKVGKYYIHVGPGEDPPVGAVLKCVALSRWAPTGARLEGVRGFEGALWHYDPTCFDEIEK
jgi:hypothetical protein